MQRLLGNIDAMVLFVQDQNWEDLFAPFREASASAQNGPAVIISVLGQPFSLTVQDVTALSKAQFATIYTVSAIYHLNAVMSFQLLCYCPEQLCMSKW